MIRISTISFLVLLFLMTLAYAICLHEFGSNQIIGCGYVEVEEPKSICGNAIKSIHSIRLKNKESDTVTIAEGKSIFKANCASCHAKDMKSDLTGPALSGVERRWAKYPKKDLYNYIRNSQAMTHKEKHPKAIELWSEWQPTIMNNFPNLTDNQIKSTLLYIEDSYY